MNIFKISFDIYILNDKDSLYDIVFNIYKNLKMKERKVKLNGKVNISIDIPLETMKRMEEIRRKDKKTRSGWIAEAILEKLSRIVEQQKEKK